LIQTLLERVPFLQGHDQIVQIHKGYSSDSKFIVKKDNQQYLLKTFDNQYLSTKQMEFDALFRMQELNVKCSKPIEIGNLVDVGVGYMILTYIEGNDAADELPKLSADQQFRIGYEAGTELLKMHQYVAPRHIPSWYDRKVTKHTRYVDKYHQLNIRINNDLKVMTFIEDNLHLMERRPNLFQHDDFHVGNLIVKDERLSGIIDFNRCDWGDPIHEFLKVGLFSSEVSIPFSIGQIRGYHLNSEPDPYF
jgi:aminoglycoside phosphotransferase (APT) family kinase protein